MSRKQIKSITLRDCTSTPVLLHRGARAPKLCTIRKAIRRSVRTGVAIGVCTGLIALSGCSEIHLAGGAGAPVTSSLGEPVMIDIFSARGFLGGSDYERYYLQDGVLWRECGTVSNGKKGGRTRPPLEGDAVLKSDPQLSLRERRVERLNSRQSASLTSAVSSLISKLEESNPAPAPGSVFSLSDPGLFEMMIGVGNKKHRLITSVDAVADRESPALDAAHQLFAVIRGVGPEICGASTFFGIARATTGSTRRDSDPESSAP